MSAFAILITANAWPAQPGGWSEATEVRYEDQLCVSYRARLDGPYLVVRATLGTGWHTFAMDNKRRAEEKPAGKPALSVDRATEIVPAVGLQVEGPWYQTPPKDLSHPELRWFSWGFDREALFVAKVRTRAGTARLAVRGQACTETICKNIDVAVVLPAENSKTAAPSEIRLTDLIAVR